MNPSRKGVTLMSRKDVDGDMCIVPDHEIIEMMESGRLVIKDYSDGSLTPNGYDLRIAEIKLADSGETHREGTVAIGPGKMFFVSTIEHVELPNDVAAQLWTRTSWIRKGLMVGLGKIDAGFHGTLTFTGFNASSQTVEVPIGCRFVQMVLELMHSGCEMTYEKRSGNYQGQKGITLAPVAKK